MSDDIADIKDQLRNLTNENRDLRQALLRLEQKVTLLAQREVNISNQLQKASATRESDITGKRLTIRPPYLPLEVLRIIFLFCLPAEGNAVLSPHEPPLLFGRVCRLWRNLAWSTPELWDTLHIVVPGLDYEPFEYEPSRWDGYIFAIECWLERSGTRRLSLSLVDDNPLYFVNKYPCSGLIEKVIERISEESARWQHLKLQLSKRSMKSYFKISPTDCPKLETFIFRTLDEGIALPGDDFNYSFTNVGFHQITTSPSLRTLCLGDSSLLGIRHADGLQKVDFANLVELSLGDESRPTASCLLKMAEVAPVLTRFENSQLRTCRLVLQMPSRYTGSSFSNQQTPLTLPSLQNFAVVVIPYQPPERGLYEIYDEELEELFSYLCFPVLRSFEYKFRATASTFPFLPFLKEVQELEALKLYTFTWSDTFAECLDELCADLKELHLSAELSTMFMDMGETAFPNLEILRLDCGPPVDRTQLLQDIEKAGKQEMRREDWEDITTSTPELTLRRFVERKRYNIMDTVVSFIQDRCWPDGSQCESEDQSVIRSRSPLRHVDFRLNERLRGRALAKLAPVIEDGLSVCFREDYFNILPPPSDTSVAQSWNISPDSC